jgi:hypothetical protein
MSTERSTPVIFGTVTGDSDADKILGALRGNPDGMSRHEIRRTLFGANKPAGSIAALLETLQGLGLVNSESIRTRGRPTTRWYALSASNAESRPAVAISPPDTAPVEPEPEVEPAPLLPPTSDDSDERPRRAAAHLAAREREGGHGPAWEVARLLIEGVGLTVDEAFPLIADWNRTCRIVLAGPPGHQARQYLDRHFRQALPCGLRVGAQG